MTPKAKPEADWLRASVAGWAAVGMVGLVWTASHAAAAPETSGPGQPVAAGIGDVGLDPAGYRPGVADRAGASGLVPKALPVARYVADLRSRQVLVMDESRRNVLATIPVGARGHEVAVDSDGARAFVANLSSGKVTVIDMVRRKVVATVPLKGLVPGSAKGRRAAH